MALTAEQIATQQAIDASANSVSTATLQSNGSYERDFTGNDLYFAHITAEVERKKFSTQPDLNDSQLIAAAEQYEKDKIIAAVVAAALEAGWVEVTEGTDGAQEVVAFPETVSQTTVVKFNGKFYKKTV